MVNISIIKIFIICITLKHCRTRTLAVNAVLYQYLIQILVNVAVIALASKCIQV